MLRTWKLFLYLAVLMTAMALVAHGTQDMYPTFLERQLHFRPTQRALVTALTLIGAIIGGIFFGHLSDRFGRRRTIFAALLGCLAVTPLWAFAGKAALLVLGGFLMQFFVQAAWRAIPAHLAELSPDGVRGFLPSFAYQCGTLLAGSVAYLEAVFAQRATYAVAMAETAAVLFAFAAIVIRLGPERLGVNFGSNAAKAMSPLASGQ
jgi:SHS family lactate transporter-like MFS transporter